MNVDNTLLPVVIARHKLKEPVPHYASCDVASGKHVVASIPAQFPPDLYILVQVNPWTPFIAEAVFILLSSLPKTERIQAKKKGCHRSLTENNKCGYKDNDKHAHNMLTPSGLHCALFIRVAKLSA